MNAAQDSRSTFLSVNSVDISDERRRLFSLYFFMETKGQFPAVFMASNTENWFYCLNISSCYIVIKLEITPKET